MGYRIIETTDHQNRGQIIAVAALGEVIALRSGFYFKVERTQLDGDLLTLSNPNYIVIARKE